MVRLLPATSRDTSFGSMPGNGTSIRQPSSVAFTWNDGDDSAAVRVGRSLQNWLKRRSTSRWKLNTSSNEFQRVRNIAKSSLLQTLHDPYDMLQNLSSNMSAVLSTSHPFGQSQDCLLYTSDAADERS